ncbi:MAG: polysaccharide deacetylase family protein [Candidatus Portnoybacteria bacterium]|nr:polysaccharide deacetylase family protein [Candidatus Portnoybacteria bacterium]MDD4982499.1 polysaccharide deacetylase family protein [Candidatus Portnoybacteria bacterium]
MKRETIKKIIYLFLNAFSIAARLFYRSPRVSILMYHSIGDNGAFFTVTPKEFAWQMAYLNEHDFQVVSLAQLTGKLKRGEKLSDKTVALTFDDGYADNFTSAWPILKKYNFPATIFLATDYIGRSFTNSENVRIKVLDQAQIKEMVSSGLVEFGSHTHTHPRLENLSAADFIKEVRQSKEALEDLIGQPCRLFAYPKGCFRNDFFAILKEMGFTAAFSVKEGLVSPGDELWALKRNFIYRAGGRAQFKGKLTYSVVIYNWPKNKIQFYL